MTFRTGLRITIRKKSNENSSGSGRRKFSFIFHDVFLLEIIAAIRRPMGLVSGSRR
jgi:hypothetical protein